MAKKVNINEAKQKEKSEAELVMRAVDLIKQGIKVAHLLGSCSNSGPEFVLSAMIMVNADFLDAWRTSANLDKKEMENLKKTFFGEIENLLDKYESKKRKEGN